MPDLRETRKKLKLVIAVIVILDVAAIALLLSPWIGSERGRRDQLTQLWQELQLKTKQVEPLRGMDKKILTAQEQIDTFYKKRIPAQDSVISDNLGKLAAQNGVRLGGVKYKLDDAMDVGVRPMEIDAELSGDYLHLVRFVNALERSDVFFLVNKIDLAGEQNGAVKLQIKMETYLRTGA
jgi:Tfp pilus assembly protein PilO